MSTMEIVEVDKKLIKAFVNFPSELYKNDTNFVPYMLADQTKVLKKLLLKDKTYTALLAMDGKKVLARVMFTISKNKQLHTEKCGFFCMFECVNDQTVCNALLDEMKRRLVEMGAEYISGTYFPFDQDNRRGILVEGFHRPPLIFTSYNFPYYNDLLVNYGLEKQTDALEYAIERTDSVAERIIRLSDFAQKRYGFHVDTLDWKNLDRDIDDFHQVMLAATNEIIYQDAPTKEALYNIVKQWKKYLNKDFILIARTNEGNKPIGVCMALPDFFQIFRAMRGKMDLRGICTFLRRRKKITAIRGILQYVIPEYQIKGAVAAMYEKLRQSMDKHKIEYIEVGTIMEANVQSNGAVQAVGGKIARVYRIYYLKLI